MATTLLVGIDDNGQPTYKANDGQYARFGVRIWPEVLRSLRIDPAASPVPAAQVQASQAPTLLTFMSSLSWERKAPARASDWKSRQRLKKQKLTPPDLGGVSPFSSLPKDIGTMKIATSPSVTGQRLRRPGPGARACFGQVVQERGNEETSTT